MVTLYGWLETYRKQVAKNPGGLYVKLQTSTNDACQVAFTIHALMQNN